MNRYGQPVSFESKQPLAFPDFVICYVGADKRHYGYDDSERWVLGFEITSQEKTDKIEWMEPGPQPFEVDGKKFFLELEWSRGQRLPSMHLLIQQGEP